jgi:hypothetical protein
MAETAAALNESLSEVDKAREEMISSKPVPVAATIAPPVVVPQLKTED